MSLKQQLAMGLSLAFLVMWLGAVALTGLRLEHEIDEIYDSALQDLAQSILPLAYAEVLAGDGAPGQHIAPLTRKHQWISYVVRDAKGNNLLQSSDDETALITKSPPLGFSSAGPLRLFTVAGVSGSVTVTTAENEERRAQAVRHAMGPLLWPMIALVPATLLVVWGAVGLTFRPVARFTKAIIARDRGNLHRIADRDLPKELRPVAVAVNGLIGRLKAALEAEQAFTANSAHELRTPIAAALAQTQRLIAETQDDATRERAQSVASALRRLSRLSEKLLQLAKAEGGTLIAVESQALGPVLRLVLSEITRSLDPEQTLVLQIDESGPLAARIDPDAFAILARNLIENAIRHGSTDGEITITLSGTLFSVANAGPVFAKEQIAQFSQRFARGNHAHEGAGLGLAIVTAICRGAALDWTVTSPRSGRDDGVEISVLFATASPQG